MLVCDTNQNPIFAQNKILKNFPNVSGKKHPYAIYVSKFYWNPLNLYFSIYLAEDEFTNPDDVSLHICPVEHDIFYYSNIDLTSTANTSPNGRRVDGMVLCDCDLVGDFDIRLLVKGSVQAEARICRPHLGAPLRGEVRFDRRDSAAPFLISGDVKSGTTWLESIANCAEDVLCLHEGNSLNILEEEDIFDRDDVTNIFPRKYVRWLPDEYSSEEFTRFMQISAAKNLLDHFSKGLSYPIIIDRTPGISRFYADIIKFWNACKVVHISRHPLDVLISRLFHELAFLKGGDQHLSMLPRDLLEQLRLHMSQPAEGKKHLPDIVVMRPEIGELAAAWLECQQDFLRARDLDPRRFLLVRYEDFIDKFDLTCATFFSFLGTKGNLTATIKRAKKLTSFKNMSGGRKAGQEDTDSFFRKGIAGDYKTYLSPLQQQFLWEKIADVATAFGYRLE